MSAQPTSASKPHWLLGVLVTAIGLYFMLIGFGLIPVPGGTRNLHGPLWIVLLVGLAFFLAGAALLLQAVVPANAAGELPADAPLWIRMMQYLMGVTIFATFAVLGTWVSFAGDSRHFSGGLPFLGQANVWLARLAFGFGALICWIGTIGFAVAKFPRIVNRENSGS